MIPEEELRQMYWNEEMTQLEIGKVCGVGDVTISRWMKLYGIKSRSLSEALLVNLVKPSKDELDQMYWGRGMTQLEIGKVYGVGGATISQWMKGYSIISRTVSESLLGKIKENARNWRGGTSFEPYCEKFNNGFKEAVRERDDYICQLCGCEQNGRKLDVHHIHYDKDNCYPDVVALCRSCNSKVNGDRDYWERYFEDLLMRRGMLNWSIEV